MKKIYLKNLINNLINKNINKKLLNNKKGLLTNNIKSILIKYNNKWDYTQILYKYNNNNLLNTQKNKYLIYKYIKNMLNHKINNTYINILYKKPIILYNNIKTPRFLKGHGLSDLRGLTEIILFIYKPKIINKKNNIINSNILINKLINNLINKNLQTSKGGLITHNNFMRWINNYKIKPIILTYDYLDSEIYSKSLGKFILKNAKFDKISNININNNIINKELSKKWNNMIVINKINQLLNIINKLSYLKNELSNPNLDLKNKNNNNIWYMNWYNKNEIINNNLLYKFIIGYDWKYKGKNYNSESNARALRYYINKGKLNLINNNNKSFKLNNYSNNLTKSQSFIINKNGKFNINVTLSHF